MKAIDRAERVRWAMLCRGFKRKFYSLHEFKAGRGSVIFLIFISAAVLASLPSSWGQWHGERKEFCSAVAERGANRCQFRNTVGSGFPQEEEFR